MYEHWQFFLIECRYFLIRASATGSTLSVLELLLCCIHFQDYCPLKIEDHNHHRASSCVLLEVLEEHHKKRNFSCMLSIHGIAKIGFLFPVACFVI